MTIDNSFSQLLYILPILFILLFVNVSILYLLLYWCYYFMIGKLLLRLFLIMMLLLWLVIDRVLVEGLVLIILISMVRIFLHAFSLNRLIRKRLTIYLSSLLLQLTISNIIRVNYITFTHFIIDYFPPIIIRKLWTFLLITTIICVYSSHLTIFVVNNKLAICMIGIVVRFWWFVIYFRVSILKDVIFVVVILHLLLVWTRLLRLLWLVTIICVRYSSLLMTDSNAKINSTTKFS